MRVVHLLAPAKFGGLESVVRLLASGQREHHDVQVVALLDAESEEPSLIGDLRTSGVEVIVFRHPARAFRAQRRDFTAYCADFAPQVIHSHGYLPDVLAASLGRTFSSARVTTVHGFTGGSLRNNAYELMQRAAFFRFDAVVAVSRKLAVQLRRTLADARVHALPNAWSVSSTMIEPGVARQQLNLSSNTQNIAWVGRMSLEKGPDVMIAALSLLTDRSVHLSMIGEGPMRTLLEQRAESDGTANRVTWFGPVKDAANLLPAFDMLVISSRTEGTPIILFEAMQAGLPVVTTTAGGIPDVVTDKEALLVKSDDPPALASAIRALLEDRDAGLTRARNARARLERDFAANPWIARYDDIYRSAIARAELL